MKTKIKYLLITVLFVLLLFAAFYNGLVVRNYVIHTDKLGAGESVRIVLIADLHNHIYDENQNKIVSLIKKQNPDMIALAGDIADDQVPIQGTELFLAEISGVAPVYYVSGNHEFWTNDIDAIKDIIRSYGVTVLENSYEQVKVNNLSMIVGGVDDPEVVRCKQPGYDYQKEMLNAFSELEDKPDFKVLIAHRPELIEVYKQTGFELVLSGHAHGGQVRIPFLLNGLLAPNQGWFPQYAGGMYEHESLTHIVSRGVSFNPRLPRIFNPPEVVVIDIRGISRGRFL